MNNTTITPRGPEHHIFYFGIEDGIILGIIVILTISLTIGFTAYIFYKKRLEYQVLDTVTE